MDSGYTDQTLATLPGMLAAPANGTTPPRRQKNAAVRKREYLTEAEIVQLRKAASLRDSTMILLAFRHGLRVAELVALEWRDMQDLANESRAGMTVRRLKGSIDGNHPLEPDEVTALRKLLRAHPGGVYLFPSARGGKMTPAAFRKQLSRIAEDAGLAHLHVHPHMLRHSCGRALVDQMPLGMLADYLGHAQIQNTRIYSRANGERFRGIWRRRRK